MRPKAPKSPPGPPPRTPPEKDSGSEGDAPVTFGPPLKGFSPAPPFFKKPPGSPLNTRALAPRRPADKKKPGPPAPERVGRPAPRPPQRGPPPPRCPPPQEKTVKESPPSPPPPPRFRTAFFPRKKEFRNAGIGDVFFFPPPTKFFFFFFVPPRVSLQPRIGFNPKRPAPARCAPRNPDFAQNWAPKKEREEAPKRPKQSRPKSGAGGCFFFFFVFFWGPDHNPFPSLPLGPSHPGPFFFFPQRAPGFPPPPPLRIEKPPLGGFLPQTKNGLGFFAPAPRSKILFYNQQTPPHPKTQKFLPPAPPGL